MFYVPLALMILPSFVVGIDFQSAEYFFSLLFFTLSVAIAEEIYFRGIIYKTIKNTFASTAAMIILTSLIFGIGHGTSIIGTNDIIATILQIVNAIFFGVVAIETVILTKSLYPAMLLHFVYNLGNYLTVAGGSAEIICVAIQAVITVITAILLGIQIKKNISPSTVSRESEIIKRKRVKKALIIIGSIILSIAIGLSIFFGVTMYQLNQIPKMSFDEMLKYTTNNKEDTAITVGIIKNGETSYKVYGKNGTTLENAEHTYEIGSITKTVTATLIFKAASEGKLSLDDSIDKYLALPKNDYYPTIKRLLTHTSGYKGYYFESEMIGNFFGGRNDFCGISTDKLLSRIGKINLKNKDYKYEYSNFGFAVLGLVLSEIYETDYTKLVNAYLQEDFGLTNTKISDGQGDLGKFWDWKENDAYLPSGGLTSTISDMLKYVRLQLGSAPQYLINTHNKLAEITDNSQKNKLMNIQTDYSGAAWVGDTTNNIIWHNGGTGNYNSYIGFDMDMQIAVVVLSNLAPSFRIPATVMGIKLLTDLQKAQ